jgi:hypothetical protein
MTNMKRIRLSMVTGIVSCLILLFAMNAFAQVGPTVMPVQPLSMVAGVGMVLGLVLGYINQGIASGSILVFGIPKLWAPYLSMAAVFLTSFIPQFVAMTTLSGLGVFYAFIAGLTALVTYNAGATLRHQHDKTVDTKDDDKTAPGVVSKIGKGGIVAFATVIGTLVCFTTTQACKTLDPILTEFGSIGAEVVKDIQAGESDTQIIDDIESMLGANATVEEATNIVMYVLNELIESGILAQQHPELMPKALALQSSVAAKRAK